MPDIRLEFPLKGLNQNWAQNAQPDGTTPSALNVMPYDAAGRRARGGQRAGTSKLFPAPLASGNVMALKQATRPKDEGSAGATFTEDFQGRSVPLQSDPDGALFQHTPFKNGGFMGAWGPGNHGSDWMPDDYQEVIDTDGFTVSFSENPGAWGTGYALNWQPSPTGEGLFLDDWSISAHVDISGSTFPTNAYLSTFMLTADLATVWFVILRVETAASGYVIGLEVWTEKGIDDAELIEFEYWSVESGSDTHEAGSNPFSSGVGLLSIEKVGNKITARINGTAYASVTVEGMPEFWGQLNVGCDRTTFSSAPHTFKLTIGSLLMEIKGDADVSGRETFLIAVADGRIFSGNLSDGLTQRGTPGILNPAVKPAVAEAQGKVYFTDGGEKVRVLTLDSGTVADLSATAGVTPTNIRYCSIWRDRLLLIPQQDRHNILASRAGTHTDFDFNPAVPDAQMAWALNSSEAGRIGQPIRALVPFRDDVLLIGMDSSIHAIEGDPADGGSITVATDSIGMYGWDCWTMDPQGTVWFVGTGGFYRMAPGGAPPQNISQGRLDEVFTRISRSSAYVELEWDRDAHGCWIFITSTAEAASFHVWYDARTDSFWLHQFPIAHGPMSALVYDGDEADDRILLLGGRDGYIRKMDPTALSDDGTAIESFVFFGPINPGGRFEKFKITETEFVLATGSNINVNYAFRGGDDAAAALTASPPAFSGTFTSGGRQPKVRSRARMNTGVLVLHNNVLNKTWAVEQIMTRYQPAGRQR